MQTAVWVSNYECSLFNQPRLDAEVHRSFGSLDDGIGAFDRMPAGSHHCRVPPNVGSTRAPLHRRNLATPLVIALTFLGAAPLQAQCPDGTPPPCRGASRPTTVARAANSPLNPKAWIVVPFANAMKAADLDWLRDGSANLLSMDMGRWTDISVVPDKRVADLLRTLPSTKAAADALTLNDGLLVARRAGAAHLVMGDYFRLGTGARLVANVFDVKTGNRIRTVSHSAADADSLLSAFGPLARFVLAVPPPPDAKTGDLGTRSIEAYQEYLLGVKALNRFEIPEASQHLTRALALDSTFALAHLQYSIAMEWGETSSGNQMQTHALAARRFGSALPRRERLLIEAGVANAQADYPRLCAIAKPLVAQDSTDIQALFFLGECSYHDNELERSPADSTTLRFRTSFNTAKWAFERILELDPTYLGAFEHIIALSARIYRVANYCGPGLTPKPSCPRWRARLLKNGDTIQTVPAPDADGAAQAAQAARWSRERPALAFHEYAVRIAQQWLEAAPASDGARFALARAELMRGRLVAADEQLRHIPLRATPDNVERIRIKMEVAAKLGRGSEARAMFDSLVKMVPDSPDNLASRGSIDLMFGRLNRFNRAGAAAAERYGPAAIRYQRHVGRALLGFPMEGMARDEAAFMSSIPLDACDADCRFTLMMPTLAYALHEPTGDWSQLTSRRHTLDYFDPARALALHDTAELRRVVQKMERESQVALAVGGPEFRSALATDAYLILGDSTSALRMARFATDSSMVRMGLATTVVAGIVPTYGSPVWPRMMLKRADLAAARGFRDEAREWYTKVLSLWENADPEMQPFVARIRASLAKVGPRG